MHHTRTLLAEPRRGTHCFDLGLLLWPKMRGAFLAAVVLLLLSTALCDYDECDDSDLFDSDRVDNVSQASSGAVVQASPGVRPGSHRYHLGDGYFFHRQRVSSGRVFLRCILYRSNPSCPVRAVMNSDMSGFQITTGEHNHAPDVLYERVQALRCNLLEACRVRPNARVDLIYHDVCRNVPRDVSSRLSLLSVRSSMIRVQGENRPNIPHTFEALDELLRNHNELRMTLDLEQDFYQGMTGAQGHRSLLFMSRRVVAGGGDIHHLFGDGTFFSRPNQPESAQVYTLVTVRDNHVLPLGYALMESRTEVAYRELFQLIRQISPELDPHFFMTDFEVAQQSAILEVFPRVRLSGCLWHYARAVCRNVRSLGLFPLVRDNINARRIVRLSLAIPLAPPDRVAEALNAVVMECRRLQIQDSFADFFRYIRTTWIDGVGGRVLSVFGVRHRSNNVAECHHRNLNARLVRRPNLWRFIDVLREMEDIAWRDLGRLELGQAPSRARRVSSLLNDARVRSCSRQVINREMDMLHFLSSTSWHLDNTMNDMLRVPDEEGRPPSPERGPPNYVPDSVRFAPENMERSSVRDQVGFDVDFQECANGVVDRSINYPSLDESQLFDDLMEDSYEHAGSSWGRRRRGGGRRGARARGGMATHGRASTADSSRVGGRRTSLPAPSCTDEPQRNHPEVILRPALVLSDSEELTGEMSEEHRRWECIICNSRRGWYSMLGCGAFPICGQCVNQWFNNLRHHNCPHCGGPNLGWVRLNF